MKSAITSDILTQLNRAGLNPHRTSVEFSVCIIPWVTSWSFIIPWSLVGAADNHSKIVYSSHWADCCTNYCLYNKLAPACFALFSIDCQNIETTVIAISLDAVNQRRIRLKYLLNPWMRLWTSFLSEWIYYYMVLFIARINYTDPQNHETCRPFSE